MNVKKIDSDCILIEKKIETIIVLDSDEEETERKKRKIDVKKEFPAGNLRILYHYLFSIFCIYYYLSKFT